MAAQSAYSATPRQSQEPAPDLRLASDAAAAPASEQLLPLGASIGDNERYVIQEVIAVGGMATVYKASDSRLGSTPCAVKSLFRAPRQDGAAAKEDVDAFREEARLLASLRHPGIVAVRDYFEEETAVGAFAFIVQEFVDGQNLYDRHRRLPRFGEDPENLPIAPVPEDQVALYGLALARALDYLHTRAPAILYRDLKPHNIVRRSSDGQIVLLDFGISKRVSGRLKRCYSDDLGTPGYAAPEQYEKFGILDARTDLYSLGVVLAELATGYNPRAENAAPTLPRLDSLPGRLSPSFRKLLQKCVEPLPAARYATAQELVDALEEWRKTPRRMRRFQEPSVAWTLAPEFGRLAGGAKSIKTQLATIGESGEVFAFALPSGALQILEAASGQTLAERKAAGQKSLDRRFRICAEPGGGQIAQIDEPGSDTLQNVPGAELVVFDRGLKVSWRLGVEHGRLLAAWTSDPGHPGSISRAGGVRGATRLALSSRKSGGDKSAVLACAERSEESGSWSYAWRTALSSEPRLLASSGDGGVLAMDAVGGLTRFDSSGARRWFAEIPFLRGASAPARIAVAEQRRDIALICIGTSVEAIGLESGAGIWRAPWLGFALSAPQVTLDGSRILLPTRECGLVELDAETGRTTPLTTIFPHAVSGLTRVLPETDIFAVAEFCAGARLVVYDAASRKTLWNTDLPGLGAAGAPCVSEEAETIAVCEIGSGGVTAWRWSSA